MSPRKSRAPLWLLLGAAVAIGAFAARPWLARQVAAVVGDLPGNGASNVEPPPLPAAVSPPPSVSAAPAPSSPPDAPSAIGIASTPASPSAPSSSSAAGPRRGGEREEHIVIHDRVEPEVSQPATPVPERKPEPVAVPPPAAAPPAPPPPAAPKPKQVPVSDADRYGI
jgi:hypothetical protein